MFWNKLKTSIKTAGTKTITTLNTINDKIDTFEVEHFGNLDDKFDILYDKYGNLLATKTKHYSHFFKKLSKEE